jgi:FAD/FMN-containing dehydrogenase
MNRRKFLQTTGVLAAHTALASGLVQNLFIENTFGQAISVQDLQKNLSPEDATILTSASSEFEKYQWAYNRRTMVTPMVRVLCRNEKAVAESIKWAETNQVPLAPRCGGHSYEGFSQSKGLVLDLRLMNDISISQDQKTVSVGSGALLGQVYEALSRHKLVLPAGSCPTVGISGHTTGGGYGLLSRPLGLACDSLLEIELIDANGKKLVANSQQNPDLLWAYRGGGGSSFGVITKLHYKTHQVSDVLTFGFGWDVDQSHAMPLLKAWQEWAPNLPSSITSLLSMVKNKDGSFQLRCKGQSVGSATELKKAIDQLQALKKSDSVSVKGMKFIEAAHYFAGGAEGAPKYRKVKCDYLTEVMSDEGLKVFLSTYPAGQLSITHDAYGGAISQVGVSESAFAHRAGTLCSVKYSANWEHSAESGDRIELMRKYHESLKSYVSGGSYVNYCDLDLKNYGEAYWGQNFERLKQIKRIYDPKNFFRHAQSIPVG